MTRKRNMRVAPGIRFVRGPIDGVTEYKMDNGLKILLMPDQSTAAVTCMVVYRVGSRNEGPGEAGSAHFFEHLMFKGSQRFNPDKGTNLDELLKRIGANYNAYTWNDQTVYFEQVPAEYLDLALAIEADRMRNLRVTKADRDSEMTVVRNEMEQGENHPAQVMSKLMWATAFTQHPYHHDTIGSRTEVENVPLSNMRAFYNLYYWPNNATLIIAGNGTTEQFLTAAAKHFGPLPKSPHKIPRVYCVEPAQEGERRFAVRRAGNVRHLSFGFHVPNAYHEDMPALQVLCDVLGNGWSRSSRLYQRLVATGMTGNIWCNAREMRDPGLLQIDLELTDGTDPAVAEAAVLEEIEKVKTELTSDEELARIKTGHCKQRKLQLAEATSYAYKLASAEASSDWTMLAKGEKAFCAVTAQDIRRVAAQYLTKDNCTVGVFVPKNEEEVAAGKSSATKEPESVAPKAHKRKAVTKKPGVVTKTLAKFRGTPAKAKSIAERVVTRTLANGLTVNVLPEKHGSDNVAIGVAVRCGNYFEKDTGFQNLTDIVASMLPLGSNGLSKSELANVMTSMGKKYGLNFHVGPYLAETHAQVVTGDLPKIMTVLSTVMREPLFNESELDTIKKKWEVGYLEQQDFPGAVTQNILGREMFDEDSMFWQKDFPQLIADLKGMTVADVRGFHNKFWSPSATIITVVGDISVDDACKAVEAAFGNWQGPSVPAVSLTPPAMPEARTIVKKMPDKPGVSIMLGRPANFKRTDADYEAVKLSMQVLGGDTLTARLGKKIREEEGLTYGVYCSTWDDSYGTCPFYISLSTNPKNVRPAINMANEIFADFVANGITDEEFQTQVDNMSGSHQLQLSSLWSLARQISECTALGVSFDSIDGYPAKLRAMTREQVNEAIKKHFGTDHFVTVIAGDVAD